MVMGSSCHKGAQKNFGQKIESHKDLPVKEIVGQTMAYFDENIKDVSPSRLHSFTLEPF